MTQRAGRRRFVPVVGRRDSGTHFDDGEAARRPYVAADSD